MQNEVRSIRRDSANIMGSMANRGSLFDQLSSAKLQIRDGPSCAFQRNFRIGSISFKSKRIL